MLRRRILASAMASVMALGSVAIVASAEETAVKPVKTRADLEALVGANGTYGDAYRSNDIYNYGTKFGDLMLDTLEFADTVLDDAEATTDDFTAAYDMVVAVAERFVLKSAAELKELIDACKGDYERENINNAELGDLIYTPDSFQKFEVAYEDAEGVLDSGDSRIITDAFLELKEKKDGLAKYASVTKTDFTNAVKAMEKALDKEMAYDQWRRGTTKSGGDPFWFDWYYSQGRSQISYGELFDWLKNYTDWVYTKYDEFVEVKTASKTTLEDIVLACQLAREIAAQINNFEADNTNRATKASVTKLLDQYHGVMVFDFATAEAAKLYAAIYAAVTGAGGTVESEVMNGKYETKYEATTPGDVAYIVERVGGRLVSATMSTKSTVAYYILLDENGYAAKDAAGNYQISLSVPTTGNYKKISARVKTDLTDYIEVLAVAVANVDDHQTNGVIDADDWTGDFNNLFLDHIIPYARAYNGEPASPLGADNFVAMKDILPIVYNYLNGDYNDIYTLNTNGTIAAGTAKGSASEWTIVYRALKYVLEDRYGAGTPCEHKRKDVSDLIEKSYELEAETSKAAIFADSLEKMVAAREIARDWLKQANADKKYKDNIYSYVVGQDNAGNDVYYFADDTYHHLLNFYEKLSNDLAHFAVSFGDVYELIAEVEDKINEGELEETKELRAAISEAAYRLAIATEPAWTSPDPDADLDDAPYTEDRMFVEFNRIYTGSDDSYGISVKDKTITVYKTASNTDLKAAYDALKAAAEAKPAELKGDYDGNGKIDAFDAAAILKDIAAAAEMKAIGDYDADGKVDALDAAKILKGIANGDL